VALLLYEYATRSPLPVISINIALPLVQSARSTISWITEVISLLCWSGPASFLVHRNQSILTRMALT